MAQTKMLQHLLLEDPEGAIYSGEGGTTIKMGTASRWRFACRPTAEASVIDLLNRATPLPWLVFCNACKATAEFKAIDRPRPGSGFGIDLDHAAEQ